MAEYLTNDTDLKTVADAIRTKTGTVGSLTYPSGFASAIAGIAADCDATAGDILPGKTAWVGNAKITGNMSGKSAATYNTSSSDQTISANQYLSGAQTIKAVRTENISAANIKAGVVVKVGDENDDDRIAGVTGTFTNDANATSSDIISGKTAYVSGVKVTGNLSSKSAETFYTSTSDQSIPAGKYLSGAQTIKGVTTSNIDAANIKAGVTVKVGDSGSATRIKNVTGTFTNDANASASDILSGKTAYKNGSKLTGTISSKSAVSYGVSTSQQTIASGQYLSGAQTILALTYSGIEPGNIKKDVNVQIGDTGDNTRIMNITGTCVPCTTRLSDYCPYMWQNNQAVVPKHYYDSDTSGDHAAERTPGYRINVYESKNFIVPCNIKVTYFAYSTSESTSSVTLTAGTVYNFQMADNNSKAFKIMEGSTGKISRGWKVTKWEVV